MRREYTQPDLLQGYKRALANLTRPTQHNSPNLLYTPYVENVIKSRLFHDS